MSSESEHDKVTPNLAEDYIEQMNFNDPEELRFANRQEKITHIPDMEKRTQLQSAQTAFTAMDLAYYVAKGQEVSDGLIKGRVPDSQINMTRQMMNEPVSQLQAAGIDSSATPQEPNSMAYFFAKERINALLSLAVDIDLGLTDISKVDPEDLKIIAEDPTLATYLRETYLPQCKEAYLSAQVNETLNDVDLGDEEPRTLDDITLEKTFHNANLGYSGAESAVYVYLQNLEKLTT